MMLLQYQGQWEPKYFNQNTHPDQGINCNAIKPIMIPRISAKATIWDVGCFPTSWIFPNNFPNSPHTLPHPVERLS
jgi:hypothetical protein